MPGMVWETEVTEALIAASDDVSASLYASVNSCHYI